jgi:hypothetical protein
MRQGSFKEKLRALIGKAYVDAIIIICNAGNCLALDKLVRLAFQNRESSNNQ